MKEQSMYTQSLYDVVRKQAEIKNRGKIKLDFSNPEHRACMVEPFGGENAMREKFPRHYDIMENTLKSGYDAVEDTKPTGFVDYSTIDDIFYASSKKELSTLSYLNLTGKAKTIQLWVTIYRGEQLIASYSDFYFNTDHADIDTLLENISSEGEDKDDILVIFHATWIRNNLAYSELNYDWQDSRRFSMTEVVDNINVIDPRNRNTPATSNINVAFGRGPERGEVLDYSYLEARAEEGLQKMYLELNGDVTLLEGVEFVRGDANNTGIVLNHELGSIIYSQTIPDSSITKVSFGKFKWNINYDWQNTIPISVYAGVRAYEFSMKLSFYAIPPDQTKPLPYSITIHSSDKPSNSHYEKINHIELKWGCLAENSLVRMADGSEKMIQHIAIGDMVKTPAGKSQKVMNVWTGTESEILHLETEGGKVIRLTETHPIMTTNGLKPVIMMDYTDMLLMEDGSYDNIKFCYTLPYNNKVYNLDLADEHLFICDGFVVGDNKMQNELPTTNCVNDSNEGIDEELLAEANELKKIHNLKEVK